MVKNLPVNAGDIIDRVSIPGWVISPRAGHSSVLAWRIPWAEEPSRLQSMGLQRVGHN